MEAPYILISTISLEKGKKREWLNAKSQELL